MNDFNSIDLQELDTVTGGRNLGPLISKAKDWGGKAWNAAEKAVTGLGIADAAGRAWDWANGGNKGGDSGGSPAPRSRSIRRISRSPSTSRARCDRQTPRLSG